MAVELTVVDAFADRPFSGNPAAVCLLDRPAPDRWMQDVAAEMHLSETAFAVARTGEPGAYDLRWFTPTTEVDLCGHATLATAHVVGGGRFHTRSGILACTIREPGFVEMDFPADPPRPVPAPVGLWEALGVPASPGIPGTPGLPGAGRPAPVLAGRDDLVVVVGSATDVRTLRPDLGALATLPVRTVVVTAPGDRAGIDCVSRVFGPAVGVPEDPVTGSAHCTLAPWWSACTGRTTLVGEQASRRGGFVHMRLDGGRVVLGGCAVTVSTVRLLAGPD